MKTIIRVRPFGVEFEDKEMKDAARASGVWIVTVSQGEQTVVACRCCGEEHAQRVALGIASRYPSPLVKIRSTAIQFA